MIYKEFQQNLDDYYYTNYNEHVDVVKADIRPDEIKVLLDNKYLLMTFDDDTSNWSYVNSRYHYDDFVLGQMAELAFTPKKEREIEEVKDF